MAAFTSTTNWILNTILKPKTFPTNRECSKQDQKMALYYSLKERFFVMLADLSLDQIFSETVQCFHKWRRIEASPKKGWRKRSLVYRSQTDKLKWKEEKMQRKTGKFGN